MLKTFKIPTDATVVVLEDMDQRIAWFRQKLIGVHEVWILKAALICIEVIQQKWPAIIFLDHDLGFLDAADPTRPNGNGKEVARFLRDNNYPGTVILHSLNPPARDIMAGILPQAIIAPYGSFQITLI